MNDTDIRKLNRELKAENVCLKNEMKRRDKKINEIQSKLVVCHKEIRELRKKAGAKTVGPHGN